MSESEYKPTPEEIDEHLFQFFLNRVAEGEKATMAARLFPITKTGLKRAQTYFGFEGDKVYKPKKTQKGGKNSPTYDYFATNHPEVFMLEIRPPYEDGDIMYEFFRPEGGLLKNRVPGISERIKAVFQKTRKPSLPIAK